MSEPATYAGSPQSAAAPSPFPPIADYAFLSNCHTGALVAPDGAIDWLCVPAFDRPASSAACSTARPASSASRHSGINHPASRARGAPQHYVSSKLMGWVALDRAAELAEIRGDPKQAATWRATAEEIRTDILEHGLSERGVLRQHYETDSLDASVLLAAIFGFLPGDDERLHATVTAIAEELTEDGFVLRYRPDEPDDGLSGKEGTFLICSFWLVSAFAIVGELQRARDLMEKLLRIGSPLGLYAEEFDADTGRHLGNFPQAFSHLALMEAAARIIVPETLGQY
jgi:alpha,alpha-trehalase